VSIDSSLFEFKSMYCSCVSCSKVDGKCESELDCKNNWCSRVKFPRVSGSLVNWFLLRNSTCNARIRMMRFNDDE
jgi:hypothetical protein